MEEQKRPSPIPSLPSTGPVTPVTPVTPLTHRNGKTGRVYRRDPEVEQQIEVVLQLSPAALRERLPVRDREDPGYLREESLVYLVRTYNSSSSPSLRTVGSDVAQELVGRIENFIMRKLINLGYEHFEEGRAEVHAKLFEKICNMSSDLGDFAQVAFWEFLSAMTVDTFHRHARYSARERKTVAPAWVHGSEPSDDAEAAGESEPTEAGAPLDSELITEELLGNLKGEHLGAMKLHLAGWPVESIYPDEPTISNCYGKSPRTIRNWLRSAEQTLAEARKRDEL